MNLGIYELLYEVGQRPILGTPFLSYDTSGFNRSELRELLAFEHFAKNSIWASHNLSGLLSPRFTQKTGLTSSQVVNFIEDNPGYQVYLFHPYPNELLLQNHFLELAELEHPGITDALDRVWRIIFNSKREQIEIPQNQHICCHCNYFVADQVFWKKYGEFVCDFLKLLKSKEGAFLTESTPYTLTKTDDVELPMGVFVFERALSHFINQNIPTHKVINLPYSGVKWSAPELFAGEFDYVQSKLQTFNQISNSKTMEFRQKKSMATFDYFNHRKMKATHE